MLACVLFTVFDFVQGDDLAAAAHLQGGLAILRKFVAGTGLLNRTIAFRRPTINKSDKYPVGSMTRSNGIHSTSGSSANPQQNLIKIFAYLDFWSLIWSDGESLFPEITLIDGLTIEPAVRDADELHFQLRCFGPLENRIHEFLRASKTRSTSNSSSSSSKDETAVAASFSATKQDLVDRLSNWHRQLSDLCVAEYDRLALDEEEKRRIHVTTLNYNKIRAMLLACQTDGSSNYRGFDSAFANIVSLSTPVINDPAFPTMHRPPPAQVFSFVPGLIHPLFITATCCCDPEICGQAIGLLQSQQWSEGAWNSTVMAKVARRKLDERERNLNPIACQKWKELLLNSGKLWGIPHV